MQTETTHAIPTDDIADADDIQKVGGQGSWRFARGKIVRGPEESPKGCGRFKEETTRLVGRLMRVGIYHGRGKKDGREYLQVEADLEYKGQTIYVKAALNDPMQPGIVLKPSVSAVKFAWGLTRFKRGDVLMIETALSDKGVTLPNGSEGEPCTYVNWFRVEGKNAIPEYSPRRKDGEAKKSTVTQWLELEPLIRAHGAFEDRPEREDDDYTDEGTAVSHLVALCDDCKAKGWPTPREEEEAWLDIMAKAFTHERRFGLEDYEDDDWGQIRLALKDRPADQVPQGLVEAKAARAASAQPASPAQAGLNMDAI